VSGIADERLETLAEHLRLPDLPVLLPEIVEAAVAGEHSYAQFTEGLLATCAAATDERAAETIARLAGFPTRKTRAEFDFGFQPSINRHQVSKLADCAFVERAENVARTSSCSAHPRSARRTWRSPWGWRPPTGATR
jgi:DNA replication protein DnaC